jgi:hypothetical protein
MEYWVSLTLLEDACAVNLDDARVVFVLLIKAHIGDYTAPYRSSIEKNQGSGCKSAIGLLSCLSTPDVPLLVGGHISFLRKLLARAGVDFTC